MEFYTPNDLFDNNDSINFFNYLLKKNLSIDKISLIPCTKMKNRINIQIILNDYKTVICPVQTTYHWFAVTRQHILDKKQLNDDDVHEFSTNHQYFDKLFNFIWGNVLENDLSKKNNLVKTINEIKSDIKNMKDKMKSDIKKNMKRKIKSDNTS